MCKPIQHKLNLTLTRRDSFEYLVIETATYASIAAPLQANSLYFLINLNRCCQDISTLSLVFPICPVFLFLFYSLVNRANLPIKFIPFIWLQIFHDLCVFIPYHLHFKLGVQKACCFSICILLFLFIHTTAPPDFVYVCLFIRSIIIDSSVHLCLPNSFQFVFVSAFTVLIRISIIPVIPPL